MIRNWPNGAGHSARKEEKDKGVKHSLNLSINAAHAITEHPVWNKTENNITITKNKVIKINE